MDTSGVHALRRLLTRITRVRLILAALALGLYGFAATWGLPHATNDITVRGWDVDGIGGISVLAELHNFFIQSKPDWYVAYPLFHYVILSIAYAPYLAVLWLRGEFVPSGGAYPYGFADPTSAIWALGLIARCITVVMAVGVVLATREIGARIWNARAGLIAALIVLVCGPFAFYARTSNLDVPVQFWTVAGILAAVIALKSGLTVQRGLLIGALVGISVATKDQVYGAWLPALIYLAALHAYDHRESAKARWLPVVALLGSATIAYAVGNGIVFRPDRFVAHVRYLAGFQQNFPNLQHSNELSALRPATPAGILLLFRDVATATALAIGAPLFVLGAAGLFGRQARNRAAVLLMVMCAGYLLLTIAPVRHMQYRYALFPGFVLALFAGSIVTWRVQRRWRQLAYALLVIGIAWRASATIDLTYLMKRDARYSAGKWLHEHARAGDVVAFYGAAHQLPYLPNGVKAVQLAPTAAGALAPDPARIRWVLVAPDYFSDPTRHRSLFLPEAIYQGLHNGSLAYREVAMFSTRSLIGRRHRYFPYVDPPVQVFEVGGRPVSMRSRVVSASQ